MRIKLKDLAEMFLSDDSRVRIINSEDILYDGSACCIPSEYMDMYISVIAPGVDDDELFLWLYLSHFQD